MPVDPADEAAPLEAAPDVVPEAVPEAALEPEPALDAVPEVVPDVVLEPALWDEDPDELLLPLPDDQTQRLPLASRNTR